MTAVYFLVLWLMITLVYSRAPGNGDDVVLVIIAGMACVGWDIVFFSVLDNITVAIKGRG